MVTEKILRLMTILPSAVAAVEPALLELLEMKMEETGVLVVEEMVSTLELVDQVLLSKGIVEDHKQQAALALPVVVVEATLAVEEV